MRTLIIVSHPNYASSTTQHFLKESVEEFQDVTWHHLAEQLNEMGQFNRQKEQALIEQHDRMIFQFPLYWYSAPYLLKQWIDEVIDLQMKKNTPKELGLVVSIGVKAAHFQSGARERFTLSELYRPFEALAHALNWTFLPTLNLFKFNQMVETDKKLLLMRYRQYVQAKDVTTSLINRENWALDELHQLINNEKNIERRLQLETIQRVLMDNQSNRLDLEMDLTPFRMERD